VRTSEVISLAKLLDIHLSSAWILLDRDRHPALDEEELLSRIPFTDDVLPFSECTGFENVGDLGPFLGLKGGKDGNLG